MWYSIGLAEQKLILLKHLCETEEERDKGRTQMMTIFLLIDEDGSGLNPPE